MPRSGKLLICFLAFVALWSIWSIWTSLQPVLGGLQLSALFLFLPISLLLLAFSFFDDNDDDGGGGTLQPIYQPIKD
mgnify:CR=1 FL=1